MTNIVFKAVLQEGDYLRAVDVSGFLDYQVCRMGDPEVIFENKQRGNWGLDSTQPSSVRLSDHHVCTWDLKFFLVIDIVHELIKTSSTDLNAPNNFRDGRGLDSFAGPSRRSAVMIADADERRTAKECSAGIWLRRFWQNDQSPKLDMKCGHLMGLDKRALLGDSQDVLSPAYSISVIRMVIGCDLEYDSRERFKLTVLRMYCLEISKLDPLGDDDSSCAGANKMIHYQIRGRSKMVVNVERQGGALRPCQNFACSVIAKQLEADTSPESSESEPDGTSFIFSVVRWGPAHTKTHSSTSKAKEVPHRVEDVELRMQHSNTCPKKCTSLRAFALFQNSKNGTH
ncbi:hypothetical protein M405DRAFT_884846 [Rhizopogon salebrosus TDB-379]|nr:hypothetical protein M405DRAFT_884846 [Rhizopogon salebrosus TDB-379]